MKISVKKLPKSLVEISVEVGSDEMSKSMDVSAKKMAAAGTFDGFRQGKAPVDVVYQRIGKQKIFEDAVQMTIEKSYGSAVKDNKLIPIGYPKAEIKKAAVGNELIFNLVVTVLPEVKLGDYSKIKGRRSLKKSRARMLKLNLRHCKKSALSISRKTNRP